MSVMEDVFRKMVDPGLHLADMDRLGIDMEVLSSSTVIQGTAWAEPPLAFELDRRVNDAIAAWVERHPDRIIAALLACEARWRRSRLNPMRSDGKTTSPIWGASR
jgi:predicted TIM-barrel fold metal-dependent hydrolase